MFAEFILQFENFVFHIGNNRFTFGRNEYGTGNWNPRDRLGSDLDRRFGNYDFDRFTFIRSLTTVEKPRSAV